VKTFKELWTILFHLHNQKSSTSSQWQPEDELESAPTATEYMLDKDDYKAAEEK
jgi:hypothetical protein